MAARPRASSLATTSSTGIILLGESARNGRFEINHIRYAEEEGTPMTLAPIKTGAHGLPGELVVASIRNPIENRHSTGKPRPAVIIDRVDGHYRTMGLTSNSTYRTGLPRVPVPDPRAVGLHGPGYLWGDRLTNVSVLDVGHHIGWVDSALAEAIIQLADLPASLAHLLRDSAAEHHLERGR